MPWRRIWALAAVIAKLTTWALAPPEGCPDVVWTEFCAGTTTCETLALAGLTCGGITVIPGCDAICGSPCCISTTTTTIVTHTVTHSVTTATVTSVTATTSYTSVTGTAPSTRTITMVNPVTTVTSVKTVPLCDLGCRIDSIGNVNPWRGVYRLSPQPPPRDGHTMVLDVQQRMWVFGGYEPVGPPRGRMNDLHYFDIQARKWNKVNVRNAPSKRYGHTAVLDTQQRMWIFGAGSFWNSGWLNDLHYFDTKARQWHEVTAKNAADAPVGREGATAVLYGLEMWIFAGYNGWKGGWLNDLHYFDIQAEMWHEAIVSNAPSERYSHSAVLDVEQRMWIFGGKGRDDSDSQWVNDLHYFNLKAFNKAKSAHLWHKVTTNTAPSERYGHTAVLDDQQRMWIFGGHTQSGRINDLHYLDIKALVWHEVSAGNPPSARESHKAVLDAERRMLIFGGKVADGVRGERLNDLLYFDTKVERAITTTTSTASTSTSTKTTETTETTTTTTTTRTTTTTTTAAAVVPMDPTSTPTPSPTMSVTSTTPSAACKLFTCPRGYVRKNVSQIADRSSRTYLYQECCEPSCQLFRCPKGHTQTSWSHEIAGSQIACCKEITTAAPTVTCEHFPCPRGYIHKNLSQTGVAGRSYQTCCDRSCLLLKCPPGHEKIKGAEDLPGSTETCCRLQASSAPVSSSESTSTSGSIDAAESFVDEQLPESDVDLPAKNTSHQDQELEQPEAEAHYVPILAVGLPVLLACLLITICLLCRRLRKLRGAEAEAELPETSNPLSLLRPFRSTAKPMLFAWDARMTAEWPRGKVLEVIVEEGVFYANGRCYTFRAAGPSRHFAWEDGTIQRLERIERNVAWWSTQHEHLAWREFRWICAPQCHVEDHDGHDMELTDLTGFDGYRCMLCSRPQAADQHWHCPLHDVHLCPNCAEVPPKTPTLGVAATYLVNIFPTLASRAAAKEDPNFHEICPRLAHGPSGMGFDKMCPRDGRPHCSIVDALEDAYSGQTTHFVSWCWNYSLQDVVSAVERWLQKSGEDQRYVFLWMCFFCNNQYRIKEEACQTGSEDLKCIFESHLVEAGRMLVLLDTIIRPTYVMRAWCIFESYVCIARDIPMSIILPATAEAFFRDTVTDRGIRVLMEAVEALNVRDAKASSTVDEDLIKQIILNTTGFDVVNNAVRTRLVDQLAALFRELLLPQPR